MRYIKPVWLTHSGEKKDFEVYSCHVSPDGTRLVTAAGDGHVRVWSTEAIRCAGDPLYTRPKQLASMSTHSGTIHTVRFSSNNRYLASGADDKIVCIYSLDPNPPSHSSTFGTNEPPPVEHWRVFRRLIGHDNDVQDLGWSYDSSILVSVGLDSKVVVWSGHTFEKLKTLASHQSHVKGLTFDPANKYFATASDDRTIKIFRFSPPAPNASAHDQLNNFQLETTIQAPFVASPLTTYFRRCSWSPDGNHIAAANAVNGPVPSVAIVNRGTWDSEINLIGHEGPVEVCAFSPRLFAKEPPAPANTERGFSTQHLVTVVACAGQDKALSVWNTSHPRPLVITQELAKKSISDLAWSPDGRSLFATSLDGSIIAVVFDEGDLGYIVASEENEKALAKFGAGRKGAGIVEGTDGLLLEEKSKAGEITRVEGRMGELMGDGAAASKTVPAVNGHNSSNATNDPAGQSNGSASASASEDAVKAAEEQQRAAQREADAAKLERLKQRVTITKDGKKRIAPLLLSGSSAAAAESSLPTSHLMATSTSTQGAKSDGPHSVLDLSKPFDGLPRGGLTALLLGNKRKGAPAVDADAEGHVEKKLAAASLNGATPILASGVDGLAPAQPSQAGLGLKATPEFIRPAVVNPSLSVSQLRLAVPKLRSHIVRSVDSRGNVSFAGDDGPAVNGGRPASEGGDSILEAKNPSGAAAMSRLQDREPARLTVTKRGQTLWQDFVPRNVLLVTGNQNFWAAACEEGSIYAWTPAGRRSLNAMVVEAQPVILESRGWWLLCLTAVGLCHVWNLQTLSSPHPPVSLAPVLDIAVHTMQTQPTVAPSVTSAHLNSEGRIVVTLNNGEGYGYSAAMYVWQRLSEPWWALGSQYWNTTDSSVGNLQSSSGHEPARAAAGDGEVAEADVSAGIIPHLERRTTNEVLLRGRGYHLQRLVKTLVSREGFEGFETGVSIAHLENRMAAAMLLGARAEFRMYLYMYAKRIGTEGLKGKVDELLSSLLGPIFEEEGEPATEGPRRVVGNGWQGHGSELCGLDRRELLKGVVLILGKHRDLQRITVPYANLLGLANGSPEDKGEEMMNA
ncbi:MAG: HIR complex subunit [Thelocarpon impressellum]|nr:MAG: HIR complex subunit [Thelocarpon impressellum]